MIMATAPVTWTNATIAGTGLLLCTVATRGSFFLLKPSIVLPPLLERALRFAPGCAIAATLAPNILLRDGRLVATPANAKIWAIVAATLVFLKYRSMLAMMIVGFAVLTAVRVAL